MNHSLTVGRRRGRGPRATSDHESGWSQGLPEMVGRPGLEPGTTGL